MITKETLVSNQKALEEKIKAVEKANEEKFNQEMTTNRISFLYAATTGLFRLGGWHLVLEDSDIRLEPIKRDKLKRLDVWEELEKVLMTDQHCYWHSSVDIYSEDACVSGGRLKTKTPGETPTPITTIRFSDGDFWLEFPQLASLKDFLRLSNATIKTSNIELTIDQEEQSIKASQEKIKIAQISLALIDEIRQASGFMQVTVNGKKIETAQRTVNYHDIISFMCMPTAPYLYTITYQKGKHPNTEGTLTVTSGDIEIVDGMKFDCCHTGNA